MSATALLLICSFLIGCARRLQIVTDTDHAHGRFSEDLEVLSPRSSVIDAVEQLPDEASALDALAVYLLAARSHSLGGLRAHGRDTREVFERAPYNRLNSGRSALDRLRGGGALSWLFPGNPPRQRSKEFEQALKSGGKTQRIAVGSQKKQTLNRSGLNRRSSGGRGRGGSVKKVHSKQELEALLEATPSKQLVVLDFFATWCGPCQQIAPVLEAMAATMPHVTFVKIDVDQAKDLQSEYQVSSMPTFKFLKGGKEVDSMQGADEAGLREKVEGLAGKPTAWAGAGSGRKL